jgi:hypothetical protein
MSLFTPIVRHDPDEREHSSFVYLSNPYRRLNLSTRPAVSTMRCSPVKKG